MKTLRGLMEKGLTLFEKYYALPEGITLRRHQTPMFFRQIVCNLTNEIFFILA